MRKHTLLVAGIAVLAVLTVGTATSRGQTGNLKGTGRRIVPAGPRQHSLDSTSSAQTATREVQTPSDLKVRPRSDALSPDPIQSPTVAQPEATAAPAAVAAAINLDWVSINHGGAIEVASGDLRMGVSLAQSVAGFVAGGPYQMGLGFWYGTAAAGGGCACDCFGDPMCDGVASILDVVRAVDVAFRGGAPYFDPNPACPFETTDVTCDGVTTILDVVRMVDVAFRGGDAEVLYCDPCAP
ncbi:MAG TPA: hypothetical protein VM118_02670 [Acidobacteriota bacterium]|nr:hypothetical protein [Acidobacteriota bacterium]